MGAKEAPHPLLMEGHWCKHIQRKRGEPEEPREDTLTSVLTFAD